MSAAGALADGFAAQWQVYGRIYGMKTTIYIPDELKAALARRARIERRSEADIIREALIEATAGYRTPARTVPLGSGAGPHDLSERLDEWLRDFGAH